MPKMPNLYQEYGPAEFDERVCGAAIMYEGKPCLTKQLNEDHTKVKAVFLSGTAEKVETKAVAIPVGYFVNMEQLQYPTLGYRTAAAGQYLAYFTRAPTAVRKGLHMSRVRGNMHRMSMYIAEHTGLNMDYYGDAEVKAFLLYNPNILTLTEGLKRIKAGDILSFLLDENFAVVPAATKGGYLQLFYRERLVGGIKEDGTINIDSKWAKPALDTVMLAKREVRRG